MLRDAKSLDVIETLLLTLADCEQRVAWIDGETTPETAGPQSDAPADSAPRAVPIALPPDPGDSGRAPQPG